MAKYVDIERLEVLSEQLDKAAHGSRRAFNKSDDEYFLGEAETYDECAGLIDAVIREHAVTGRLKWND